VHCNPSTRPTVVQDGREGERWSVVVSGAEGASTEQSLLVERGTRAALGDVVLG
jgi:hypothetical protein